MGPESSAANIHSVPDAPVPAAAPVAQISPIRSKNRRRETPRTCKSPNAISASAFRTTSHCLIDRHTHGAPDPSDKLRAPKSPSVFRPPILHYLYPPAAGKQYGKNQNCPPAGTSCRPPHLEGCAVGGFALAGAYTSVGAVRPQGGVSKSWGDPWSFWQRARNSKKDGPVLPLARASDGLLESDGQYEPRSGQASLVTTNGDSGLPGVGAT